MIQVGKDPKTLSKKPKVKSKACRSPTVHHKCAFIKAFRRKDKAVKVKSKQKKKGLKMNPRRSLMMSPPPSTSKSISVTIPIVHIQLLY